MAYESWDSSKIFDQIISPQLAMVYCRPCYGESSSKSWSDWMGMKLKKS